MGKGPEEEVAEEEEPAVTSLLRSIDWRMVGVPRATG